MRMVIQNYRNGKLSVRNVPEPKVHPHGLLVRTRSSLVSAGTERLIIETAKKSLIGKARARPDLVRRVLQKVKTDGLRETYRAVKSRLDQTVPLGYSSSGVVEEVAPGVEGFEIGDRVACFGAEYASHAEIASVPAALTCKIPDTVGFDHAAFAGLGAIAIHSINHASVTEGQKVAVIGLGLLGLLAVQILTSKGCRVYGVEPDEQRANLAKSLGATDVLSPEVAIRNSDLTLDDSFRNFDRVFIFASSMTSGPIDTAARLIGNSGKLIVPGMVGLNLPRHLFYEKEIELVIPRSAGNGSESAGIIDPNNAHLPSAVKNLDEAISLVANKKVSVAELITDRYPIVRALSAYDALASDKSCVGILLYYGNDSSAAQRKDSDSAQKEARPSAQGEISIGFVGAGMWAKNTLLPEFKGIKNVSLAGVVTRNPANASHIAERWGFGFAASSIEDLIAARNIDAIVIATRHDTHASLAVQALNAGKDVLVEKPPAVNINELSELETVQARSKRVLFTGFNRRFAPDSAAAREFVGNSRVAINCRVNPGPIPPGHWSVQPDQGGRIIGEMCHFVDLLNFIAGSKIIRVSAESITGESGTSETVSAVFAHENGTVSNLLYGADGDRSFERERIEIVGAGGVFTINDFKGYNWNRSGKKKRKRRSGIDRGHEALIGAFVEAVNRSTVSPGEFEYISDAMKATFAIDESTKTHASIDIAEMVGRDAR